MDTDKLQKFLEGRGASEDKFDLYTSIAEEFEDFLKGSNHIEAPTPEDVFTFSNWMMAENQNTHDNYLGLALYGRFTGRMDLRNAVVSLLDGAEVMDNLYEKAGKELGKEGQEAIFASVELPPLGTPSTEKTKITQTVMEKLESRLGEEGTRALLADSLRDLDSAWYANAREKYLELGDFDAFLKWKGEDFTAQLEKIKAEDDVFFTQKISDEVIAYVEANPEIRQGVREGNILYEAKIPYMAIEYLAEKDETMKRYYYCHCPWARESILQEGVDIPPNFCSCSSGYHKKYYEAVLEQALKAEVLESVLAGDPWCKFAIHLPEGI
ncbi:MAG: hypothetical protein PVF83_13255 [Anaerolineales bacterium]|jgi:hypothetical protein